MDERIRSRHLELLIIAERLYSGMRSRVVRQDSALSRLVLASLATRPQTVKRHDGTEAVAAPSSVSSAAHPRFLGPPGLGKTHLSSTFAALLDCTYARIECTSDLQPTDVNGSSVQVGGRQCFVRGPILSANVVLADELSNATERTQRALLAGLSEDAISINILGDRPDEESTSLRIPLKSPFTFISTQNPHTERGTYQVPRAILDRFSMTLRFRHQNISGLMKLQEKNETLVYEAVRPILDRDTLLKMKEFIFTEIKVPAETQYFIAVLTRLLDPTAADELDLTFRRLYDSIWEQAFDIRNGGRALVPVKANEMIETRAYRLSDLILDTLTERAVLFLRYLGKALAFTKTEQHQGVREHVVPSDVLKVYREVMFHRIAPTRIVESMPQEFINDAIIGFVLGAVREADWFRAELPRAAKKAMEDGL